MSAYVSFLRDVVIDTVPIVIAESSLPKKSFAYCALIASLDPVKSIITTMVTLAAAVNSGFRDSTRYALGGGRGVPNGNPFSGGGIGGSCSVGWLTLAAAIIKFWRPLMISRSLFVKGGSPMRADGGLIAARTMLRMTRSRLRICLTVQLLVSAITG